jgi:hypothetical protein
MLFKFLVVAIVVSTITEACTTFAVGKKATIDGSVMTTHSNDGSGERSFIVFLVQQFAPI